MPFTTLSTRSSGYRVLSTDWNGIIDDVNWLGQDSRAVMVTDTATTSVATATWQQLTFATEEYDSGGFHSTSTNTSRLTVPTGYGGIYQVTASVTWTQNAGNGVFIQIRKNGAASTAPSLASSMANFGSLLANGDPIIQCNGQLRLAAGDYLEVYTAQNSGGSLALKGTTQAHRFGITWIAA